MPEPAIAVDPPAAAGWVPDYQAPAPADARVRATASAEPGASPARSVRPPPIAPAPSSVSKIVRCVRCGKHGHSARLCVEVLAEPPAPGRVVDMPARSNPEFEAIANLPKHMDPVPQLGFKPCRLERCGTDEVHAVGKCGSARDYTTVECGPAFRGAKTMKQLRAARLSMEHAGGEDPHGGGAQSMTAPDRDERRAKIAAIARATQEEPALEEIVL